MPTFEIESGLTSAIEPPSSAGGTRIIEVAGRAAGGGRHRARFVFCASVAQAGPTPVGYLTDAGPGGVSLIGWLPAAEYEPHRRVLEAGGRLRVHYETRDGCEGYLRRLALGRAGAPPLWVAASRRTRGPGGRAAFAMPL